MIEWKERMSEWYFHNKYLSHISRLTTKVILTNRYSFVRKCRKLILKRPTNSPKYIIKNVLSSIWRFVKPFNRSIDFRSNRTSLSRSEKIKTLWIHINTFHRRREVQFLVCRDRNIWKLCYFLAPFFYGFSKQTKENPVLNWKNLQHTRKLCRLRSILWVRKNSRLPCDLS